MTMSFRHSFVLAAILAASVGPVAANPQSRQLLSSVHLTVKQHAEHFEFGSDAVGQLMQFADDACFVRGADAAGLLAWADQAHGSPTSSEQLRGQDNEFTTMVGGWMFKTQFGAVALLQSRFRAPERGYVCSITAQLPGLEHHLAAKAAFQKRFGVLIAEEKDTPIQHTDRFWIERGDTRPPVKASMVFNRPKRIITIRMIHGQLRPLRS